MNGYQARPRWRLSPASVTVLQRPESANPRVLTFAQTIMIPFRLLAFLCLALTMLAITPAGAATDGAAVAAEIIRRGDAAVAAYDPGDRLATAAELSSLYFEVFEGAGMELDLGIKSPGLKSELEVLFGAVNGQAMRGVASAELTASWSELRGRLHHTATLYETQESAAFLPVVLKSALILIREGVEAMLVVGALAAYLRRAGAADQVWALYAGVGLAIPLSLLTGWALGGVLRGAGLLRATIEGGTMLLAAAVLFYVGFWLFSQREARRWQAWIAGRVDSAISRGSVLALGGAACLAAYREGAETVLFYHALFAGNPEQDGAIIAGISLAAALLVVAYLLLGRMSLKLPYAAFFAATAVLVYCLGLVFLGQGIIELQAAGSLASTPLPGFPLVSWLGIGPSVQGTAAQGVMLLLPLLAWMWRRGRLGLS
jgi:high-affinity iron transporter